MIDPRATVPNERLATLHLDGWSGRTQQPCVVVGETPKRYRIRALAGSELRLPRRGQGITIIYCPGTHLVPKHAIVLQEPSSAVPAERKCAVCGDDESAHGSIVPPSAKDHFFQRRQQ